MHYHLQAVSGLIVKHVHTTPRKAHEHDGLRQYATTMPAIERKQTEYREMRKRVHAERLAKKGLRK
jgi:hypothetical protein